MEAIYVCVACVKKAASYWSPISTMLTFWTFVPKPQEMLQVALPDGATDLVLNGTSCSVCGKKDHAITRSLLDSLDDSVPWYFRWYHLLDYKVTSYLAGRRIHRDFHKDSRRTLEVAYCKYCRKELAQ